MPNGVFFINNMKDIKSGTRNKFQFEYNQRVFEFETAKPIEA